MSNNLEFVFFRLWIVEIFVLSYMDGLYRTGKKQLRASVCSFFRLWTLNFILLNDGKQWISNQNKSKHIIINHILHELAHAWYFTLQVLEMRHKVQLKVRRQHTGTRRTDAGSEAESDPLTLQK